MTTPKKSAGKVVKYIDKTHQCSCGIGLTCALHPVNVFICNDIALLAMSLKKIANENNDKTMQDLLEAIIERNIGYAYFKKATQ